MTGKKRYLGLFAVAAFAFLVATAGYMAHCNGGTLDFSGTQVMTVASGSMDGEGDLGYDIGSLPVGTMVFVREVPEYEAGFYSSLSVGDVLTFDYSNPYTGQGMTVTHRIVGITEDAGLYTYEMRGDAVDGGQSQFVTSDSGDVVGQVVGSSEILGALVAFVSSLAGKVCLVVVPCLAVIGSELLSISRNIRGSKTESEVE